MYEETGAFFWQPFIDKYDKIEAINKSVHTAIYGLQITGMLFSPNGSSVGKLVQY